MNVSNWVKEYCSTVGTGVLILTGAPAGNAEFYKSFPPGAEVYYSIVDGLNREAGTGVYDGAGRMTRMPQSTLYKGKISETSSTVTAIPLSGEAIVQCTMNAETYYELLTSPGLDAHVADKTNPHQVTKDQVGLGNVTNKDFSYVDTHISDQTNPHNTIAISVPFTPSAGLSSNNVQDAIEEVTTLVSGTGVGDDERIGTAMRYGSMSQLSDTQIIINACMVYVLWPVHPGSSSSTEDQFTIDAQQLDLLQYMTPLGPDYLDIGFGSNGDRLSPQPVLHIGKFTELELRYYARIGRVVYDNQKITGIQYQSTVYRTVTDTLRDLLNFIRKPILKNGLHLASASAADRKFYIKKGRIFSQGSNIQTEFRSPNILEFIQDGGPTAPVLFKHIHEDVSGDQITGNLINAIDPSWNDNGTVTLLANTESSIMYVMQDHSQNVYVQYGQHIYSTKDSALSDLPLDLRKTDFPEVYGNEMIILAQLLVTAGVGVFGDGDNEIFNYI